MCPTSDLTTSLLESRPHALAISPEDLARFWDYVDRTYYDADEGTWAEDYGTCTFLNSSPVKALREAGHTCQLVGGDEEVMEGTGLASEGVDGHDWLLVDNRWIIDQWAVAYVGMDQSVYDLQDPDDAKKVAQLYPPREAWIDLPDANFEAWFERAAKDWEAAKQYRQGLNT